MGIIAVPRTAPTPLPELTRPSARPRLAWNQVPTAVAPATKIAPVPAALTRLWVTKIWTYVLEFARPSKPPTWSAVPTIRSTVGPR
ncbi:hypothetical protein RRF57_010793 [Xylaria bambusicola]|uniref:Uncharacterized protein n=1 Tax=Xylaria bambusicola TaxID=326684 RepID=A0AAN7UYM2_9PEZI